MKLICPYCNSKLNNKKRLSEHIHDAHTKSLSDLFTDFPEFSTVFKHKYNLWMREKSLENSHNRVHCAICSGSFHKITEQHLQAKHGISLNEYKRLYPHYPTASPKFIDDLRERYFRTEKMVGNIWTSNHENEIFEFLKNNGIECVQSFRKLGFEIDIFCEDYKVGIEFNGLFWHGELNGGKLKDYHLNKTILANEHGVKLIHIFEDEWRDKKEIVKSRLLSVFGKIHKRIYARKCEIVEIDSRTYNNFLNENHLQGSTQSTVKLGLIYDSELVSVMGFSKPRIALGKTGHSTEWEMVRFCSKCFTVVVGGAQKLFSVSLKRIIQILYILLQIVRGVTKKIMYMKSWDFTCPQFLGPDIGILLTGLENTDTGLQKNQF